MKQCKKCHQWKPLTEYSKKNPKNRKPGLQSRCKSCAIEDINQWRSVQSLDRLKDLYLQRTYGVTLQWYQDTLALTLNTCPICKKAFHFQDTLGPDSPVVDHCHTTGKVRGIICNECNRGLGYFRDNIVALQNAATYLKENQNSFHEKWPERLCRRIEVGTHGETFSSEGQSQSEQST